MESLIESMIKATRKSILFVPLQNMLTGIECDTKGCSNVFCKIYTFEKLCTSKYAILIMESTAGLLLEAPKS